MEPIRDFLAKNNVSTAVQGTHTVYWMPASVFAQLPIRRWKHNRPPDATRLAEIREWVQESKRVDGIIYLAWVDNELVCYESNHRREAIKGLEGLHAILVDMMWDATDETIKQEFFRLNKAISVPELFVANESRFSVDELLKSVHGFCDNYSKLQSPSKHPQRPNFNRDLFLEDVYQIVKETGRSIDDVMDRLTRFNLFLRSKDKSRLTDRTIAKCEETGLWLFAWKPRVTATDLGL